MKNNHVLLINPWIYDFAAFDFWLKPVGLLSVGSILNQYGYHIELIDCLDRFHPALKKIAPESLPKNKPYGVGKFFREIIPKPEILDKIHRYYGRFGLPEPLFKDELKKVTPPDIILVTSGMTYWYPGVIHAIHLLKSAWPTVPVILGGIYATICESHARKFSGADYVVTGPGERAALKLVSDLTGNLPDLSRFPHNLDEFPYPMYELYEHLAAVPILTSRGCPYRCSFCASHLLEPVFKQRNPMKVMDEIRYYYSKFQIRNFVFWDDALLINTEKHFFQLLKLIQTNQLDANFHLPNGIQPGKITREIANLLWQTGFKTIRLSFESSNPQRQREMGNKVTNNDLIQAVEFLTDAGFAAQDLDVYLLMGLPFQAFLEVEESINFVHQLGVKIRLSAYSPIPGTRDWEKVVQYYQFSPDIDPLLTNNSIHPLHRTESEYESYERLSQLAKSLNQKLNN
ncbi:B12-binding domain-containing radical SAM protein [candidate division KSB1 bacterium]|nr:B12-binding domain-containing radical SAM protein [candidate division KSB1 bacterium]